MTGPDRRVRRTRQAIETALLSLITEKDYEAVTVREIIDRADVGRSTFYAHYTDKQDLLMSCLDRIDQLLTPQPGGHTYGAVGFNPGLFAGIAQQRELYRAFTPRRNAAALVHARVEQLLSDALRDKLTPLLPPGHTPPVPLEVVIRAMVGAYMGLLSGWIDGDIAAACPPDQMETMFHTIAEPAVTAALDLGTS